MQTILSPDTDRRFVEAVLSRRLVAPDALHGLELERERRRASGEPTESLARMLCDSDLLDLTLAAQVLRAVRAKRSVDAPPLPTGRVGAYALEGELGRGGMGAVFRARQVETGAVRALKVITGVPDPETLERFRREAEALARVGGEGVVPIHEVGVDRGRVFLVLGLMAGGSLRSRLRAQGRLPWRQAAEVARALARALARCHAAGLVHRDLKPDNVLFDDEGRAHLADFGCVRDLTAARLTQTGTALGTPTYMAPEQLDGQPTDARADVYALGVLLHEAITGLAPFAGSRSVMELLREKRSSVPAAALVALDVPPALDALIARALAPGPTHRPDASRFAADLEALLVDTKPRVPPMSRPAAATLLGLVLISLGLAGAAGSCALVLRPRARAQASLSEAVATLASAALALRPTGPGELPQPDRARALVEAARSSLVLARGLDGPEARDAATALEAVSVQLAVLDASRALAAGSPADALALLLGHEALPPEGRLVRGRALAATGRLDEAANDLRELVQPSRGAPRADAAATAELLGDVLMAMGNPGEALDSYRKACDASPGAVVPRAKHAFAATQVPGKLELARGDVARALPKDVRATLSRDRKANEALSSLAPALYALAIVETDGIERLALLEAASRLAPPPATLHAALTRVLRRIADADLVGRDTTYLPHGRLRDDGGFADSVRQLVRIQRLLVSIEPGADWSVHETALWATLTNLEFLMHTVDIADSAALIPSLIALDDQHPALLILKATRARATPGADRADCAPLIRDALARFPVAVPKDPDLARSVRLFARRLTALYTQNIFDDNRDDEVRHLETLAEACDCSECWLFLALLHDHRHEFERGAACLVRAGHPHGPEAPEPIPADLESGQVTHLLATGDSAGALAFAERAHSENPGDEGRTVTLVRLLDGSGLHDRIEALTPDIGRLVEAELVFNAGTSALALGHAARVEAALERLKALGAASYHDRLLERVKRP